MLASSNAHSTVHEFKQRLKNYDYLKLFFIDLNGLSRGKTYPVRNIDKILSDGGRIHAISLTMTYNGVEVKTPGYEDETQMNIIMKIIPESLAPVPSQNKTAQVFVRLFKLDGSPVEENPRWIAEKQLKRLQERGLQLLSAGEIEFRLFKSISSGKEGLPSCLTIQKHPYSHSMSHEYHSFMTDFDQQLQKCGIEIECFHNEWGAGMIEVIPTAVLGIEQADKTCLFRHIAVDTARDHNLSASFMTCPVIDDISTSMDYNLSVWRVNEEGKRISNMFYDSKGKYTLSSFCRHWLAGLRVHARGMTAICSPTVNCYRRLNDDWHSKWANWAIEKRETAFRVRNESESTTLIEVRILSSAVHPHLATAAMVAAGLDGVDRQLDNNILTLEQQNPETFLYPSCLEEALQELKKDEVLVECLGKKFIDKFVAVKRKEIEILGPRDLTNNNIGDIKQEVNVYYHSA